MISKDQFLSSLKHETEVLKHLFSKVSESDWDYRLGDNMRTTKEVMEYLTQCAAIPALGLTSNDFQSVFEKYKNLPPFDPSTFSQKLDEQFATVSQALSEVTDRDMAERDVSLPWGTAKLGESLVNMTLKFISAYRMMLFLHLKAAGQTGLNTSNCWLGMDAQSQEAS